MAAGPTLAKREAPPSFFLYGDARYAPDDIIIDLAVKATNRIQSGGDTTGVFSATAAAWWIHLETGACRGGRTEPESPFTDHVSPVRDGGTVVALL